MPGEYQCEKFPSCCSSHTGTLMLLLAQLCVSLAITAAFWAEQAAQHSLLQPSMAGIISAATITYMMMLQALPRCW